MARRSQNIKQLPVLFIACEGTSSEYQYFDSWSQHSTVLERFNRVNVYPDQNESRPKTTPYEMLKIAEQELANGAADFAWIVFDKDNHPKLPETFSEAEAKGVKIAFSSRSFEQWVLLHFEKSSTTFNASECKDVDGKPIDCGSQTNLNCTPIPCLSGHIRRQGFIPEYSKKKKFDLYDAIRERTEIAIVNAAWLQANVAIDHAQPLYERNPYTNIDRLIRFIEGNNNLIKWGKNAVDLFLNTWRINVRSNEIHITLELSHSSPQAKILNDNFRSTSFYTTNDELNNTNLVVSDRKIISFENGSNDNLLYPNDKIEINFVKNDQPYFLFLDIETQARLFVIL